MTILNSTGDITDPCRTPTFAYIRCWLKKTGSIFVRRGAKKILHDVSVQLLMPHISAASFIGMCGERVERFFDILGDDYFEYQ